MSGTNYGGKYWTEDGLVIWVDGGSRRKYGIGYRTGGGQIGYTVNVISKRTNSQFQTSYSEIYIAEKIESGEWKNVETPEAVESEEILKEAYKEFSEVRAGIKEDIYGTGVGDLTKTFYPTPALGKKGEITFVGHEIGEKAKLGLNLGILFLIIPLLVLWYFLFGKQRP